MSFPFENADNDRNPQKMGQDSNLAGMKCMENMKTYGKGSKEKDNMGI